MKEKLLHNALRIYDAKEGFSVLDAIVVKKLSLVVNRQL